MTEPRIVFTRHAETMMAERGIREEWIKATIAEPQATEPDPTRLDVQRAFRTIPENGNRVLRVVYASLGDTIRVVTAFFAEAVGADPQPFQAYPPQAPVGTPDNGASFSVRAAAAPAR
jgi:hypothetical protein